MDRILSWKIDSSTFAYIYPIKNSYISNRIPENSPLWGEIINEISVWTKDTYRANFDRMASEVKSKYGQTILWQDQYWDFSDDNTNLPVNIVLLSGKDGEGSGSGYGSGQGGDGIEVYEELRDAINKELDKAKKDIEEQNKRVEEFVEQKVGETIAEAKKTIAETEKELAKTREELETKLDGAADALDKAAALFELGEGNITGEQIKDVLSSVEEYGGWLEEYSGTVKSLKTDYDLATQRMGSIGEAEDVTDGLFARFATSLNVVSGTVGNVERSMNASLGKIEDFASWYDENADTAAEATRLMNAMSGQIVDTINFISGDGLTTRLTREMNAFSGTIKDVVMTETSGAITNVRNELNALSGIVETSVTRLDTIDGDLTSLGSRMNAEEQKMEQWMNVSDSAMSLSHDLRDTWSVESGKLSTVANLTAETDENGNIMYFVSGGMVTTPRRVYLDEEGKWRDTDGTEYEKERVYVNWSQVIGSYIQQQASSITMSVMNSSGLTAAIKLAIERGENGEEESIIKLVSDKIVITGDMIAGAISANTANIGGIHMGMGQVWSEAKNGNGTAKFRLDGVTGTLYASDADISGTIHAKSLILGNNQSIENYVNSQIPQDWTSEADVRQMITAFVSDDEFKNAVIEMGYVTEEYLQKWAESQPGLTEQQVKDLIETMAGAKVNGVLPDVVDTDGGIWKRVMIGGVEHTWKVYPGDKMVLLGTEIGENFLIDTEGLMTAHNAIVYGTIYATDGWFKGSVSADCGYFRGEITAKSGKIGGFDINDKVLVVSGDSGCTTVLRGDATSQDNKDLFQLGLDLSERKILYAYKASGSTEAANSNKIVSSDTKYQRIYLTQEQISEGDEVEAYFRNNDLTSTGVGLVTYNKFLPFDSAGTIVNIHPAAGWWGSQNKLVRNAVRIPIKIQNSGWGQQAQGSTSYKTRYEFYVRDATGDYDFNSLECAASGLPIYNTRITSNGIIYCETLNAKDGMYCGTINSDGYFTGELNCNKGLLNNVTLRNTDFNGSTFLNSGASFCALDKDYKRYLNISQFTVDDRSEKEYPNAEYYRYIKNSNGNNAGKTYYSGEVSGESITLVDIMVPSGSVITIPKISLEVWRYIPTTRVGGTGVVTVAYTLGKSSSNLVTKTITIQPKGSETFTASSSQKTLTATTDTRLTISLTYAIHLPTYYWLGADKAAASITISNSGEINVDPPDGLINNGVVIGRDGFMVRAGNYGFKVTSSGIQKYKNGDWSDL